MFQVCLFARHVSVCESLSVSGNVRSLTSNSTLFRLFQRQIRWHNKQRQNTEESWLGYWMRAVMIKVKMSSLSNWCTYWMTSDRHSVTELTAEQRQTVVITQTDYSFKLNSLHWLLHIHRFVSTSLSSDPSFTTCPHDDQLSHPAYRPQHPQRIPPSAPAAYKEMMSASLGKKEWHSEDNGKKADYW